MGNIIDSNTILWMHQTLKDGKGDVLGFHWVESAQIWIDEETIVDGEFVTPSEDAILWVDRQLDELGTAIITSEAFAAELRENGYITVQQGTNPIYIEVYESNPIVRDDPDETTKEQVYEWYREDVRELISEKYDNMTDEAFVGQMAKLQKHYRDVYPKYFAE